MLPNTGKLISIGSHILEIALCFSIHCIMVYIPSHNRLIFVSFFAPGAQGSSLVTNSFFQGYCVYTGGTFIKSLAIFVKMIGVRPGAHAQVNITRARWRIIEAGSLQTEQ